MYAAGKPREYVEFTTEFPDGGEVSTSNSDQLTCFRKVAHRAMQQFPGLRDVGELRRVHRKLVEKRAEGKERSFPSRGNPVERLREAMNREMADQVETGYFYLDQRSGDYRPTWKAAFVIPWKLAWPVTAIRKALRDRRAEKLLRDCL
ncbi:MAG: hypothetical protein ACYTKD_17055 [Planctomycetota bacterium]|jgi:hypothetical protein